MWTFITRADKQEAARAEIKIGRIPGDQWGKAAVQPILAECSIGALRHIATQHMLFAGIFTAGKQMAEWAYAEIDTRNQTNA